MPPSSPKMLASRRRKYQDWRLMIVTWFGNEFFRLQVNGCKKLHQHLPSYSISFNNCVPKLCMLKIWRSCKRGLCLSYVSLRKYIHPPFSISWCTWLCTYLMRQDLLDQLAFGGCFHLKGSYSLCTSNSYFLLINNKTHVINWLLTSSGVWRSLGSMWEEKLGQNTQLLRHTSPMKHKDFVPCIVEALMHSPLEMKKTRTLAK